MYEQFAVQTTEQFRARASTLHERIVIKDLDFQSRGGASSGRRELLIHWDNAATSGPASRVIRSQRAGA